MSKSEVVFENSNKSKLPDRRRRRKFRINWFIIAAVIFIGLPVAAFGWVLASASMDSGKPQIGTRFDGDLVNKITDEDLSKLKKEFEAIDGASKVNINLKVATMRIYVELADTVNEAKAQEIQLAVYNKLDSMFSIEKYFHKHGQSSEYDLEIYVYRDLETEKIIYYRLIKNSAAETYRIQNIGKPLDPDLAAALKAEANKDTSKSTTPAEHVDDEQSGTED